MSDRRQWLHSLGLCAECGGRDAYTMTGRWFCAECTEKRNKRRRELRAANAEKYRAQNREWFAKHIEAGLCRYCGRPAVGGTSMCEKHRRKQKARDRARRDKNGRKSLQDGICRWCDEPVEPGYKYCPKHHAELKEHCRRMSEKAKAKGVSKDHQWRHANDVLFEESKAGARARAERRKKGQPKWTGKKDAGKG